jgi:FKBP-type peptidyl-prolyl cis-trans isomerase
MALRNSPFARHRALLALLLAPLLVSLACADRDDALHGAAGAPTDQEKVWYAIGWMAGKGLAEFDPSQAEVAWIARGVADGAQSREALADPEDHMIEVQALYAERSARVNAAEATASAAFLEQEAAAEGAIRFESGLIMREIAAGAGPKPTASDTVRVHYHGTLRDSTVFDSSVDRGQPAEFPLDRVIPCWTEALTLMQVGSKSRIVCPASIAYGSRGMGAIPGDAALAFEVELLAIVE